MDFVGTGHFRDLMSKVRTFVEDVGRIADALSRIADAHERIAEIAERDTGGKADEELLK